MNRRGKGKISYILQTISIIPMLVLGVVILLVGYHWFTEAMYEEVESSLQGAAASAMTLMDTAYPGDYRLEREDPYQIYKGEYNLTGDYTLVDQVKADTGLEMTVGFQELRVLSTIEAASGGRIVGTKVSENVREEVLEADEAHFYTNAIVNGQEYFAYYAPIHNGDNSVAGFLFVGKPTARVEDAVQASLMPLLLAMLITCMVMAAAIFWYTRGIVGVLLKIRDFLSETSRGNMEAEIDRSVLKRNDELGEMGQSILTTQRALRVMVEQDTLTELYNRTFANRRLKQVMAASAQSGLPFALAIGDIDFFKRINDTYGHDCGDIALKAVADTLKQHMMDCGFVARWGGEEFLLVYKTMDGRAAKEHLDKLLEDIRNLRIPYKNNTVTLTMTFGLADGEQTDMKELLCKADGSLYEGKTSGRDCIVYRHD